MFRTHVQKSLISRRHRFLFLPHLSALPLLFLAKKKPKRSLAIGRPGSSLKELQKPGKIEIVPYQGVRLKMGYNLVTAQDYAITAAAP